MNLSSHSTGLFQWFFIAFSWTCGLSETVYLCEAENSLLSVRDMIQKNIWIQISMWHFCENFTMTSCFNWICFLEGMRQNGDGTVMLWLALLPHKNSEATVSVHAIRARVGYLRVLQLYPTVWSHACVRLSQWFRTDHKYDCESEWLSVSLLSLWRCQSRKPTLFIKNLKTISTEHKKNIPE